MKNELKTKQEQMVMSILCEKCTQMTNKVKGNKKLFDIPLTKYDFCKKCLTTIFEMLEREAERITPKKKEKEADYVG